MSVVIALDDLLPFAPDLDPVKGQAMLADAVATAYLLAPCLQGPLTDEQAAAGRAIIRRAVLRWNDAGSGALASNTQSAGPFTETQNFGNPYQVGSMFWKSEVEQLRKICRAAATAFHIDTAPYTGAPLGHAPWCPVGSGTACTCQGGGL